MWPWSGYKANIHCATNIAAFPGSPHVHSQVHMGGAWERGYCQHSSLEIILAPSVKNAYTLPLLCFSMSANTPAHLLSSSVCSLSVFSSFSDTGGLCLKSQHRNCAAGTGTEPSSYRYGTGIGGCACVSLVRVGIRF